MQRILTLFISNTRLILLVLVMLAVPLALAVSSPPAFAADPAGPFVEDQALSSKAKCTTDNCNLISNYINPFIILLSIVAGLAIVIGIIVGSIQVMSSAGDPQKSASGKRHIQNALISLVMFVLLFAFLQFIIPGGIG